MKIVIAGAGDVGFHLANMLAEEEHDIVLIDNDPEKLKHASNHLDVSTIKGNSTSYSVLRDAQVSKADLLIAVTTFEEVNLLTCMLGKQLGAQRTIARISNIQFLHRREELNLKALGVDEVISPASLAAREIKRLLKEAALTDTFDFEKGLLSLIGICIDESDPLNNKTLAETSHLNPELNFLTIAILRNNHTIIPRGNTKFELNDHVYYIALPEGVERVLKITGKKRKEIKNVMILGGSRIGVHAAKLMAGKYKVKLIEKDREKCFELSEELPDTLVINGDGRNVELLEEEGIENMDAFIAVTGDSETNIISCLVAKNHDVTKTIALVENMDYIHLSQKIGVDTLINKKLIAANFIFRYIRKGQVLTLTSIHGVDAEILEFEVKETSRITEKVLRKMNFPRNAIIGGVIRNGEGLIPMGDFRFLPQDRVIVVSRPDCIHTVESFFN